MYQRIVYIAILLFQSGYCCAQPGEKDLTSFHSQEKILFFDDFSEDTPNKYPGKWEPITSCQNIRQPETNLCVVQKSEGINTLVLTPDPEGPSLLGYIQPDLDTENYLPDSFSLEFDFLLEDPTSSCNLMFQFHHESQTDKCVLQTFSLFNKGSLHFTLYNNAIGYFGTGRERQGRNYIHTKTIHAGTDYNKWHHFAFSFYKAEISCYVDNQPALHLSDCGYDPTSFLISSNKGEGAIKLRNVKLTTGNYVSAEAAETFEKLIKEKRLTTHAVNFDVNSFHISQEGKKYLRELATFLTVHPEIELEINGHTDNTGTEEENRTLSLGRAVAIKNALIDLGVKATRLTANGYGAAQPIADNTTENGRYTNRRVEFIRVR